MRFYDEAVRLALITVWKAANRICSKRLIPFLPEFVGALECFGLYRSLEKYGAAAHDESSYC